MSGEPSWTILTDDYSMNRNNSLQLSAPRRFLHVQWPVVRWEDCGPCFQSGESGECQSWLNRRLNQWLDSTCMVKTDHLPNIHRINATHSLPADLYMSNTLKATGKTPTKKMSSINTSVGFQTMPRNTKQNQQKMSSFCHWRNSAAVQFLPRVRMKAKMLEITTKN